jgi:hypothetical protein
LIYQLQNAAYHHYSVFLLNNNYTLYIAKYNKKKKVINIMNNNNYFFDVLPNELQDKIYEINHKQNMANIVEFFKNPFFLHSLETRDPSNSNPFASPIPHLFYFEKETGSNQILKNVIYWVENYPHICNSYVYSNPNNPEYRCFLYKELWGVN